MIAEHRVHQPAIGGARSRSLLSRRASRGCARRGVRARAAAWRPTSPRTRRASHLTRRSVFEPARTPSKPAIRPSRPSMRPSRPSMRVSRRSMIVRAGPCSASSRPIRPPSSLNPVATVTSSRASRSSSAITSSAILPSSSCASTGTRRADRCRRRADRAGAVIRPESAVRFTGVRGGCALASCGRWQIPRRRASGRGSTPWNGSSSMTRWAVERISASRSSPRQPMGCARLAASWSTRSPTVPRARMGPHRPPGERRCAPARPRCHGVPRPRRLSAKHVVPGSAQLVHCREIA